MYSILSDLSSSTELAISTWKCRVLAEVLCKDMQNARAMRRWAEAVSFVIRKDALIRLKQPIWAIFLIPVIGILQVSNAVYKILELLVLTTSFRCSFRC